MAELNYTTINHSHVLDTIRGELSGKGYYLANTGQVCAQQQLAALVEQLGGFWQQMGAQLIAPQENPRFIAQTADEIPPHNECAYAGEPPRYLLLHCRENAVVGGDFFLLDSAEVIKTFSADTFSLLYHAQFQCLINPAYPQTVSFLRENLGRYHLQYSCIGRTDDWSGHTAYQPVAPFYQGYDRVIAILQAELQRETWRQYHSWQPGDLLIFDNQRFLHGRNAFQGTERQLDHLRIH